MSGIRNPHRAAHGTRLGDMDDEDLEWAGGGPWHARLSIPGVVAVVAAVLPFFAHFTINGANYVALGGGIVAIVLALIAIGWELLRAARGKGYRRGFGGLAPVIALGLGVVHLFMSGFAVPALFDRSDDVVRIVREDGLSDVVVTGRSDDGQGYEYEALDGQTRCVGSIRFSGGGDNYTSFRSCGLERPIEDLEEDCEGGDYAACEAGARRLRAEDDPRWLALAQQACAGSVANECFRMGTAYEFGEHGVTQNRNLAYVTFERACEAGNAVGCHNAGVHLRDGEGATADLTAACHRFRRGCDGDDPGSCSELGNCYRHGRGDTEVDLEQAFRFYSRACEGGSSVGCMNLAYAYLTGRGVEPNPPQAFDAFHRACEAGDQEGCMEEATMQLRGQSPLTDDRAAALPRLRALCEQGSGAACMEAGLALHGAIEGAAEQDREQAFVLFSRACELEQAGACRNVGLYLTDGIGGQTRDRARAREHFQRACDLGLEQACAEAR